MLRRSHQWRRFFHATRALEGGKTSLKEGKWQDRVKKRAVEEMKVLPLRVGATEYADRLKRCHGELGLIWAQIIHKRILCARRDQDRETYLGNILIQTYGRCKCPSKALEAFAAIDEKNEYSWTIMMGALQANDKHEEALDIFDQMLKETSDEHEVRAPTLEKITMTQATYATALRSCAALGDKGLKRGKQIHAMFYREGLGEDLVLQNGLIHMYAKCGKFEFSKEVFKRMPWKNVISYTAMISAYTHAGEHFKAFELYKTMLAEGICPDVYAYAAALTVCPTLDDVTFIHTRLRELQRRNVVVLTALVIAFARFGEVQKAEMAFDRIQDSKRGVATWNAMLAAYARNGEGKKGIELFVEMEALGVHVKPNSATFTHLLIACAKAGATAEGMDAHSRILNKDQGINQNTELKNALVEMYARCGLLGPAENIFYNYMHSKDTETYLSLMSGYTRPGPLDRNIRLDLYYSMNQEGAPPRNAADFSAIFDVCRHAGVPDEGWKYFITMSGDFGISPLADHYLRMVELLARVAKLEEAKELIVNMPYEPGAEAWTLLLSACKTHGQLKLGLEAAHKAMELDPLNTTPHTLLAGLYAKVGKKQEQKETMKRMVTMGLNTDLGKCTIEANRQINELVSGDVFHPLNQEIRAELKKLHKDMLEEGYQVKDENDVAFEEQQFHSERMAIGLGLVLTDPAQPLYIIKNSRVCPDCHRAVKFIAKLLRRRIIIKDPGRVHWFDRGLCSCGDFW